MPCVQGVDRFVSVIVPNNKYLSVREYAESIGMSANAIYIALRTKRLNGIKVDGTWIVPVNALVTGRRNRDGSTIGITDLKRGDVESFLRKRGYRITKGKGEGE